jgi:hypothetical protein
MKPRAMECLLAAALFLGCGSDSDSGGSSGAGNGGGGGSSGSSGQCPSIDGTWTIQSHCVSAQVGSKITVHQKDCKIESVDPWTGWVGGVDASGGVSMSGPAGAGASMTCTGAVSGSTIAMSCNPTCEVKLSR